MIDIILDFLMEALPEYFGKTILGAAFRFIKTKVTAKALRIVLYTVCLLICAAIGIGIALCIVALIVLLLSKIGLI